jgi:hypothetical protein
MGAMNSTSATAAARNVRPVSWRTRTAVSPIALATHRAPKRFIRNAGSPSGAKRADASHPSRTYAGKPVG